MWAFSMVFFSRLQGQTARANSSDDSTDSEEELDSPHTIVQQETPSVPHLPITTTTTTPTPTSTPSVTVPTVMAAAEKMDVDFSEGEGG